MNPIILEAKEFARSEEGATAIEYGLLAALVAVVIIGAIQQMGDNLADTFVAVAAALKIAP